MKPVGRIQGQTNDRDWFGKYGKEKRFRHAYGVAQSVFGQRGICPKCGAPNECIRSAVTKGYGAVSYWSCKMCGHVGIRSVSPEEMARHYEGDRI